jgi:hypothetical protein
MRLRLTRLRSATARSTRTPIGVPAAGGQLTFENLYGMEIAFLGMVLEIGINGGAFSDITTAGHAFIAQSRQTSQTSCSLPLVTTPAIHAPASEHLRNADILC